MSDLLVAAPTEVSTPLEISRDGELPAPTLMVCAASRFEAARRLEWISPAGRRNGLHGHSFIAGISLPSDGESRHDVGAARRFVDSLGEVTGQLDYALLNDVVANPTDLGIANWLAHQLGESESGHVSVQSTSDQGVLLRQRRGATHWRRYRFQAAHRLPYVPIGHKCGRMHGHGFQVLLYASHGSNAIDPGLRAYDLLDTHWEQLRPLLKGRCLNEVAGLENPTSEMIASWVWERIKPSLPELSAVAVYETGSCGAFFDGNQFRIWKDFTFDSAVRRTTPGPQESITGFTFRLRLHLSAPLNAILGWTVDFGDVKQLFNPLFKAIDHQPLFESADLPTSEIEAIAKWIYVAARERIPEIVGVELFETEECGTRIQSGPCFPDLPLRS